MADSEFEKFLETRQRRPLTPDESARLDALLSDDPERARRWQEECTLDALLEQAGEVAPSSNFTARVLREVAVVDRARDRARADKARPGQFLSRWLPLPASGWIRAVGTSAALAVAGWVSWVQFESHRQAQLAETVVSVSEAVAAANVLAPPPDTSTTAPGVGETESVALLDALKDYESIRLMGSVPATVDADLLLALQ